MRLFDLITLDSSYINCTGSEFNTVNKSLKPEDKVRVYVSFNTNITALIKSSKTKHIEVIQVEYDISPDTGEVTVIDASLPKFDEMKKVLETDYFICSDFNTVQAFYNKPTNRYSYKCVCTVENYDMYKKAGLNVFYIVSTTNVEKLDKCYQSCFETNFPLFEFHESKKCEIMQIFNGKVLKCLRVSSTPAELYNYIFQRYYLLYSNSMISDFDYPLYVFKLREFEDKEYYLNLAFKELSKKTNMTFTDSDVHSLSSGKFNLVYDISKICPNSVMRILVSDYIVFDSQTLDILKTEKPDGFAKIRFYGNKFVAIEKMDEIYDEEVDVKKAEKLTNNCLSFFSKHRNIGFLDFHWGNIMKDDKGEYRISDIDFNMFQCDNWKYILKDANINKEFGTEAETSHMAQFKSLCLQGMHEDINSWNLTVWSVAMFRYAKYNERFDFNEESYNEIQKLYHELKQEYE